MGAQQIGQRANPKLKSKPKQARQLKIMPTPSAHMQDPEMGFWRNDK